MKVIDSAIRFPVTTTVCVILLVMFGMLALFRLPVQLTPDVEEPEINVRTFWPGASPQEVEREIIDEQEEQLKSVEGLKKMESSSSNSNGSITLTFDTGTDLDAAVLKVSTRLEQVPSYPSDADRPVITTSNANFGAVAWFMVRPRPGTESPPDMSTLFDFVDDNVKPAFERIPGVATSNIFGGREQEMRVVVNPDEIAARGVTLNELARAIDSENNNFSGGDFDEGKRRYIVRTIGQYNSPEDIENIVVAVRNGSPVFLKDIARAELAYKKPFAQVFAFGEQVLAVNVIRESGANALEVMQGIKQAADVLNAELLPAKNLELVLAYDQTTYINSSIRLVRQSLLIGGFLAIFILLLYLRSATSTLVIAVAIPISVVGTFLMMLWLGRTLNVVSLAGMAFAVGMVVDNSIVVLENIYRHRQMGKSRVRAASEGAREVWGAVLASTLTTIAVFVPVAFIQEEVGQLFGDIAIAISCAVALSLIVSITVIPSLSAKILGGGSGSSGSKRKLLGLVPLAQRINQGISDTVIWINAGNLRRLGVILALTVVSLGISWLLMPQTDYLPVGNQNFVFGFMLPPPGYKLDEVAGMRSVFVDELAYLWETKADSPESRNLPGGGLENFFFVALNDRAFMGARARDALRAKELIPEFQRINGRIPGTFFVVTQSSIFARGLGGRSIDIEITGPDLTHLISLGGEIYGKVMQNLPGAQARPIPSLDLGNPEVQVKTNRRRAAELGISNRELGFAVSALIDGALASEYMYEGRELDLRVMADTETQHRTHTLDQLPIAAPGGELVTLGSVADIVVTSGPVTINHSERERTITIQVTPAETMPLEEAMRVVQEDILAPIYDQHRLGGLYRTHLSGTADKLTETWNSLRWNLVLALVITFLLLAALFENFVYPFVIMFSVPLAALGGILGLAAINITYGHQSLDTLTMLGFIILIGTVVNNAILIVHQALNLMRTEGKAPNVAVAQAVSTRVRPIFMSVSTSVFGMLPLVLFPGAGSELYRGLGSVVVGGLIVSTVFTLFLVPAIFTLMTDLRERVESRLKSLFSRAQTAESDG